MKITLGGNVCIRNGNELDYCWREAIKSLLPVCDEVVVCDGESSDGTQEEIREWAKHEPKIKLCVYPWPNPKGAVTFWVEWLNYARRHVRCDFQLQLDADEILDDKSYPTVLKFKDLDYPQHFSILCHRLNFWKDASHLIPHGHCLGDQVVRIAPQSVWMPSDGQVGGGAECIMMAREFHPTIKIFHYGFLRKPEAYFEKSRRLHGYFFDNYDERLKQVEDDPKWMEHIKNVEWIDQLVAYDGHHPLIAHEWLRERGYGSS